MQSDIKDMQQGIFLLQTLPYRRTTVFIIAGAVLLCISYTKIAKSFLAMTIK